MPDLLSRLWRGKYPSVYADADGLPHAADRRKKTAAQKERPVAEPQALSGALEHNGNKILYIAASTGWGKTTAVRNHFRDVPHAYARKIGAICRKNVAQAVCVCFRKRLIKIYGIQTPPRCGWLLAKQTASR